MRTIIYFNFVKEKVLSKKSLLILSAPNQLADLFTISLKGSPVDNICNKFES